MIKVLHVISDTGIGGAGVLLCHLLSEFDRTTLDLSVALPRGSHLARRIRALGIRVTELTFGADRSADLRAVPELCRLLRSEKPDILHTHSALYARLAGFFCRVPVLINTRHCADMKEHPSPLLRPFLRSFERLTGSITVATADYVKEVLVRRGVPSEKICVIHNGSRPLAVLTEEQKTATRRKYGLSPSDFVVGMVARLETGKGHETFLRAAKLCAKQHPRIRFIIVGDGSQAKLLHQLSNRLGLANRIIFTGFLSDVTPIMNILHLNVNCSERSETSSLALSEGMSLGVVPVVSTCGGNAHMVGNGQCGILFPPGDELALSQAILSLERDRPRLAALSEQCLLRFRQHFTAQAMTQRVEMLYRRLAEGASAGAGRSLF